MALLFIIPTLQLEKLSRGCDSPKVTEVLMVRAQELLIHISLLRHQAINSFLDGRKSQILKNAEEKNNGRNFINNCNCSNIEEGSKYLALAVIFVTGRCWILRVCSETWIWAILVEEVEMLEEREEVVTGSMSQTFSSILLLSLVCVFCMFS